MSPDGGRPTAGHVDAVVVGGGLVGASCAVALADRGLRVVLLDERRPGAASRAAAGMLAPSMEHEERVPPAFAIAARDRYPSFIAELRDRTGVDVPLNRLGILEVAIDPESAERIREQRPASSQWLERRALAELERSLGHCAGAVLHPSDGAVDNVMLADALERAIELAPRIERRTDGAARLELSGARPRVRTSGGTVIEADTFVLAAGAWVGGIGGLPRRLPVEPVLGQMLALDAAPLRHVVYGPDGYLVPRQDGRTLVGSTMERTGFAVGTTSEAAERLELAATRLCPPLRGTRRRDHWAGLRPVTPDLLPIIGPDPDHPALLYACGHSRNGVLLAPLTGDRIAELAAGEPLAPDIARLSIARFAARAE